MNVEVHMEAGVVFLGVVYFCFSRWSYWLSRLGWLVSPGESAHLCLPITDIVCATRPDFLHGF